MMKYTTIHSANTNVRLEDIPPSAFWLGWSGVLPFAALSASLFFLDEGRAALASNALVIYGAVILSFIGGAQWGAAISQLSGRRSWELWRLLGISVIPALVGWAAALLPLLPALIVLAFAFVVLLGFDLWTVSMQLAPKWYSSLRKQLTAAVISCLGAGAFAA